MEQILLETMQRHMEKVEAVDDIHQGFTKGKSCVTSAVAFVMGLQCWWMREEELISST